MCVLIDVWARVLSRTKLPVTTFLHLKKAAWTECGPESEVLVVALELTHLTDIFEHSLCGNTNDGF